jgi:hypothetical protein
MTVIPVYIALVLLTLESVLVVAPGPYAKPDRIHCTPDTYGHLTPNPIACERAALKVPRSDDAWSPAIVHWPLIYEDGNCRLAIQPMFGHGVRPRPASRVNWVHLNYASWRVWNDCYGLSAPEGLNFSSAMVYTHAWTLIRSARSSIVRIEISLRG